MRVAMLKSKTTVLSVLSILLVIATVLQIGCTVRSEKGSAKNPIVISLVPAKDTKTLMISAKELSAWLEKETGYHFEISIPTSYIAVVEAFGGKRVDIAYLNTTNYFLAEEKYGAEVQFITLNIDGNSMYKGLKTFRGRKSPMSTRPRLRATFCLPISSNKRALSLQRPFSRVNMIQSLAWSTKSKLMSARPSMLYQKKASKWMPGDW
jgi:hypothetical protein